jgi:multidrug transporter EmrE-like cation transporter
MLFVILFAAWLASFSTLNIILRRWVDTLAPVDLTSSSIIGLLLSPVPWVAGILYVGCAALYAAAMGLVPLSIVGPVFLAAGVLATSVLGWGLFGESITPLKAAGLAVILFGIGVLFLADFNRPN